jgi:hypothetical protein
MLKKIIIYIFMILCFKSFSVELVKIENANIIFLSSEKAKSILNENDNFVKNLSPFDRSSRLKTGKDISTDEYKEFITGQTLDWKDSEINKLKKITDKIVSKLKPYNIMVPETINFIKTTGLEEGNAAYCRGNSAIIFPESEINTGNTSLDKLIIHELFHIYSKNNPDKQEKLYNILSFKKTNELIIPENIYRLKITNPDAVFNNYYFNSEINGQEVNLMPLLLSDSKYDEKKGGEFFDYLNLYFIAVSNDDNETKPVKANDKYILVTTDQVKNYFKLIGENTGYIIHPEEILADNFVLLVNNVKNVKTKKIIDEMDKLLK